MRLVAVGKINKDSEKFLSAAADEGRPGVEKVYGKREDGKAAVKIMGQVICTTTLQL